MDSGLFIARVVFGFLMAAHGTQKLFGWLGGYGITGTAGFFQSLGFRPARLLTILASASELAGGLLLALGFLGPIGPALIVAVMIVAMASVHWTNGLFAATNGVEVPLLYMAAATALALTGPGLYSVDAATGLTSMWTPTLDWVVLAIGALGGIANLALRHPAPATAAA